eukprot:1670807-Rhodomonas_salina.1
MPASPVATPAVGVERIVQVAVATSYACKSLNHGEESARTTAPRPRSDVPRINGWMIGGLRAAGSVPKPTVVRSVHDADAMSYACRSAVAAPNGPEPGPAHTVIGSPATQRMPSDSGGTRDGS